MKKYIVALLFLLAQNMCAMELEPLSCEDDAKALRLAKLFNKYPNGYGKRKKHICMRKKKIDRFLKQDDSFSQCVKRHQKELKNIEVKDLLLYVIRDRELPNELKHKIFVQVVWKAAALQYAINNLVQFINIEPWQLNTPYLARNHYHHRFLGYFLSEINESNNQVMMFSESRTSDPDSSGGVWELTELFLIDLNYRISDVKEFNELMVLYKTIFIEGRKIDLPFACKEYRSYCCNFKKEQLEDLNSFLNSRWDRVAVFNKKIDEQFNQCLIITEENEEKCINRFFKFLYQFQYSLPFELQHICCV